MGCWSLQCSLVKVKSWNKNSYLKDKFWLPGFQHHLLFPGCHQENLHIKYLKYLLPKLFLILHWATRHERYFFEQHSWLILLKAPARLSQSWLHLHRNESKYLLLETSLQYYNGIKAILKKYFYGKKWTHQWTGKSEILL